MDENYTPGEYYPRKGLYIECPNCELAFFGRRNQKYCDSTCRNEYHNQRRNELGSHKTISELKEVDKSLAFLYKKFGSKSIPEAVISAWDISVDGANKSMETDELEITGYLNYALVKEKRTKCCSILTIEVAKNRYWDSFWKCLEMD